MNFLFFPFPHHQPPQFQTPFLHPGSCVAVPDPIAPCPSARGQGRAVMMAKGGCAPTKPPSPQGGDCSLLLMAQMAALPQTSPVGLAPLSSGCFCIGHPSQGLHSLRCGACNCRGVAWKMPASSQLWPRVFLLVCGFTEHMGFVGKKVLNLYWKVEM